MSYSERELWIFILTVMHISPMAQSLDKKTRQGIEIYLRKKLCPSITMDDWLQIEKELVKQKFNVMKHLSIGLFTALGKGHITEEDQKLFEQIEGLTKETIQETLNLINEQLAKGNAELPKEIESLYDEVKKKHDSS